MFWHRGFPAFVIACALLRGRGADRLPFRLVACVAAAIVLAGILTFVATAGAESLPVLVASGRFTSANLAAISIVVLMCCLAAGLLLRHRPHTALDLWLLVVLCALAFEMVLAGIFTTRRFDVGWYAGRLYGLFAGSLLLLMLVIENGVHFRRLARLSTQLTEANRALEALSLHDALTGLANRRSADMAARYGGEEFALILPDTDHAGATVIAEAARAAIASLRLPGTRHPPGAVTISGGITALIPGDTIAARDLIRGADQALFEAKRLGRDRMFGCKELAAA